MKVNPVLMNQVLFNRIARKLNRELDIRGEQLTYTQVALIAEGKDCTVSHPITNAVISELRAKKIKIP